MQVLQKLREAGFNLLGLTAHGAGHSLLLGFLTGIIPIRHGIRLACWCEGLLSLWDFGSGAQSLQHSDAQRYAQAPVCDKGLVRTDLCALPLQSHSCCQLLGYSKSSSAPSYMLLAGILVFVGRRGLSVAAP